MATENYSFPTIASGDRLNGVSAINGLANAVDAALKTVDDKASGGVAYELPPATTSTLGGVIVGDGLFVDGSGRVSSATDTYVLPPATSAQLGGVKIGTGISVTADGTISVSQSWLTTQINNAIADYISENLSEGFTWGDIYDHGFVHK